MAIIINFQEYVKVKGKSKQHEELKGISSEFGRILYFNKNEERIKRENLESERKKMMDDICKKCKELRNLTETYQKKFGVVIGEHLPFSEFFKILYGC